MQEACCLKVVKLLLLSVALPEIKGGIKAFSSLPITIYNFPPQCVCIYIGAQYMGRPRSLWLTLPLAMRAMSAPPPPNVLPMKSILYVR
jgi:hypothetical protein